MRICIYGMGYVGVVSAACLLRDGHEVIGVDLVESKVRDLAAGLTPIQEPRVAEMLADGVAAGRLSATTDPGSELASCDMIWICVGTPSADDGSVSLAAVESAMREIGKTFAAEAHWPLIVLRSTVLPGTTERYAIPWLEEASGKTCGRDFDVVFHPEFLREGSAVADFENPPKIVVGEARESAGDRLMAVYTDKYEAPRFRVRTAEAELVKYADNLFHATKITFANEIGAIARSAGVDARRVADVFCADTKLNISARYLRPGFAFGGSCLPKDLRAIVRYATMQSLGVPMLQGIVRSNVWQIDSLVARVLETRPPSVGMVGLAFKPDTDDMRESPYVTVAKRLIGEGVLLRIFDPGVDPSRLIGSNKDAVLAALRHLDSLLVSSIDELADCDTILINHARVDESVVQSWLASGKRVLDLADVSIDPVSPGRYEGISW